MWHIQSTRYSRFPCSPRAKRKQFFSPLFSVSFDGGNTYPIISLDQSQVHLPFVQLKYHTKYTTIPHQHTKETHPQGFLFPHQCSPSHPIPSHPIQASDDNKHLQLCIQTSITPYISLLGRGSAASQIQMQMHLTNLEIFIRAIKYRYIHSHAKPDERIAESSDEAKQNLSMIFSFYFPYLPSSNC